MSSITFEGISNQADMNGPNPAFVLRARNVGQVAAYLGLGFALTIPACWIFHYPILRPDIPTLTPAHLIGALSSSLLALTMIVLLRNHNIVWTKIIWAIILICSGIVLLEYITPDELPFADLIRALDPKENPDKIAPNGALCLFSLSLAALFISFPRIRSRRIGQLIAAVPAIVAALALIGHSYSIESLYDISDYSQMSVPGALNNFFMAAALFCVWPEEGMMRILVMDSPAGVMSRRLYAAAIIVPPALGFLTLVSSASWKWYDISFGIVLFVVASILLFATVVAVTSQRIERADLFRLRAEDDLRATGEQLRELSAHIQDMQEEERVRIAREVHDELGQSLTALKMDVSMLRKQLTESEDVERRLSGMMDLVNGTIRSVQRISSELRPSVLDDLGLSAAIEWQAREFEKRSAIRCSLDLPTKDLNANPAQATAIFRIFQETLTNVARHASAREIEVQLRESWNTQFEKSIQLRVHDDGIGFEQQNTNGHSNGHTPGLGLMGMRERAALAGGELEIESVPGEGMTVTVTMPA